ncbi:class I SAM-dependent methyltransferase [Fulvivirga sp. M361]|uniref:class I SAM-dependent methyltransferase n=1 Tax=Fulvivirga sp. M361 TaxID=2594266 RepID=UPI001179ED2F|nr:class I SAM-dependent methyltransferase [Fulvivirga sp. M361]TRX62138.1 class I SAM-dependent methyltransferase [Fulvivirga sp. M361]
MNRIELIRELIRKGKLTSYLEIGSQSGKSFLPVRCKIKIAVDPKFIIPFKNKIKWLIRNPYNLFSKYFEETSDDFFEKRKALLAEIPKLDIALIDGLHTFEASLKDTLNTLNYVNNSGIIILHDCFPQNKAVATPAASMDAAQAMDVEGWTGQWCGDVWKTIVYLRKSHPDELEAYVINTDFGLGIVRRKQDLPKKFDIDETLFNSIDNIDYDDMIDDVDMIGLKEPTYVHKLIESFKGNNQTNT